MRAKSTHPVRFILFLTITLLLAGTIFFLSSQPKEASEASSDILVVLLEKILGRTFPGESLETVVFWIRKSAHFTEYLLLGLFFSLTVREKCPFSGKVFVICGILCACYALSDEIHQHFVPGRSCELRDMCIDAAGALLGCFLVWIFSRRKK